ncbi:hypothetical protein [Absidia glauca]|uniref:FYVE-type domain-containing protein n=1 Tax=Absidia glauca TaxID=4829 RepID=A0A163M871_ABSGL|nr:hypothetical protein [Absidia glauca]
MEHHAQYDSVSQTQLPSRLHEPTVTHHDKTEESPTCTDAVCQLETISCTETTTPIAATENHHTEDQEAVASSYEQQQQQQDSLWTLPSAHTVEEQDGQDAGGQDAGGQDAGGQGMDSTIRADSTEKSLGCGDSALGTDDKKVLELEDEFGLRISDTLGSASTGATPTDTGFGPEHLLASSNTPTATTEACGNDNVDLNNSTQAGDTSNVMDSDNDSDSGSGSNKSDDDKSDSITRGLAGTGDGQYKQQSGDQPNVTSDDQIMNDPSVDVVDSASYGDTIKNLPPASTLEHTSTQPIVPGTDDERPGATNDNDCDDDDDDDDDDIPLMAQYEGDPSTILPSASTTTTTTTSLSISAGRSQAPQGMAAGDQQLTRVATTGSDEQTLSEPPRPRHVWESDRQASECRRCNRRFSFLVRRHHCRRCGQIVCDRCSSHRVRLPVDELVEDPLISTSHYPIIALTPQRVCESCVRIPIKATDSTSGATSSRYASQLNHYNNSNNSMAEDSAGAGHRIHPMNMQRTDSQQSLMTECPVCGAGLLGMRKGQQETHLNQCLNTGSPTVRPPRYISKSCRWE